MRARVGRGGARGRVGLKLESGSVGEEDGPDGRDPPGGESGRGRGRWAGWAKSEANGPARGNRATGKVLGRGERVKEKALFIF